MMYETGSLLDKKPKVRGRDDSGFLLERNPELILKEETVLIQKRNLR
jgi:hypothetical protein